MSKHNLNKSKLLKLKEWLTVPEAARHLSNILDEEVSEADVLRLALDGHLKLSVNFVNYAMARAGKVVSEEDVECYPPNFFPLDVPEEFKGRDTYVVKDLPIGDGRYLRLDDEITSISGVWDLSMIGNEMLDVEHEYQQLTGGPAVELTGLEGSFVEREGCIICQLQERFDEDELCRLEERFIDAGADIKSHHEERIKRSTHHPDNYFPAGCLPKDGVLVVRTQALIKLQERLMVGESPKEKTIGLRAETTYLNIIGALLEVITGPHGDMQFKSETALRDFLSDKYIGFQGLTLRTLADKFAQAKKSLSDELD